MRTGYVVATLAMMVAACAGEANWNAIDGLETTYTTITAAPNASPVVSKGDTVTVHATGIVKQTDKKFWSTKDAGQQPFTYTAGGGVITGWDKGAMGMKIKEIRSLHIPAEEGYGK